MKYFFSLMLLSFSLFCFAKESQPAMQRIDIFYKNQTPSQTVLVKALPVVMQHAKNYKVVLSDINLPSTASLIEKYHLPSVHFPFAVVINGKYSAKLNGQKIDFVHFPKFLKGIGRHEGNWSIDNLEKVLQSTDTLVDENVLPHMPEGTTSCHDEEEQIC